MAGLCLVYFVEHFRVRRNILEAKKKQQTFTIALYFNVYFLSHNILIDNLEH